jgi:hypothetical protein
MKDESMKGMSLVDLEPNIWVTGVIYSLEKLIVTVETPQKLGKVSFDHPIGFRVLDERDLLEYWPMFSLSNGWLYKIIKGGWKDLESERKGFLKELHSEDSEYFIVGENDCVSVLCHDEPIHVWENKDCPDAPRAAIQQVPLPLAISTFGSGAIHA